MAADLGASPPFVAADLGPSPPFVAADLGPSPPVVAADVGDELAIDDILSDLSQPTNNSDLSATRALVAVEAVEAVPVREPHTITSLHFGF